MQSDIAPWQQPQHDDRRARQHLRHMLCYAHCSDCRAVPCCINVGIALHRCARASHCYDMLLLLPCRRACALWQLSHVCVGSSQYITSQVHQELWCPGSPAHPLACGSRKARLRCRYLKRGVGEIAAPNVQQHCPSFDALANLPVLQPPHEVGGRIPCTEAHSPESLNVRDHTHRIARKQASMHSAPKAQALRFNMTDICSSDSPGRTADSAVLGWPMQGSCSACGPRAARVLQLRALCRTRNSKC